MSEAQPPDPDGLTGAQDSEDLGDPQADITPPVPGPPFDPSQHREWMRMVLAAASLVLFAVTVLLILLAVVAGWRTWTEMEGVTTAVLPVVVSVVSSAVAFYFGTRDRGR